MLIWLVKGIFLGVKYGIFSYIPSFKNQSKKLKGLSCPTLPIKIAHIPCFDILQVNPIFCLKICPWKLHNQHWVICTKKQPFQKLGKLRVDYVPTMCLLKDLSHSPANNWRPPIRSIRFDEWTMLKVCFKTRYFENFQFPIELIDILPTYKQSSQWIHYIHERQNMFDPRKVFISKDEILRALSYIVSIKQPRKQSQSYYSTL